jgi:hypothetical protein
MNARGMTRLLEALPNDPVQVNATPFQIDTSMHRRIIICNLATAQLNMPLANGSGTVIQITLGIVAVSVVIKRALAADRFQGSLQTEIDTAATGKSWLAATTANANTITLNGAGTGGASIGDTVFLIDIKSGVWAVFGSLINGSGATPATPFSNT